MAETILTGVDIGFRWMGGAAGLSTRPPSSALAAQTFLAVPDDQAGSSADLIGFGGGDIALLMAAMRPDAARSVVAGGGRTLVGAPGMCSKLIAWLST